MQGTHWSRDGYEIHVRRDIQSHRDIDINLGHCRLAVIARVWVDLPVLFHWVAAEEDGADDGDVGHPDEDVCDLDADIHVD